MTQHRGLEWARSIRDSELDPAPAAILPALQGDAEEVLARAVSTAEVLARVVRERGLALRIGDAERDFLTFPAWQALGAFLGVTATVVRCEPAGSGTFRAEAEVRAGDGRLLGAGVALASRTENRLRRHADHGLAALAQTRAMRRALQGALGWIPGLAGMDVADPTAPATRRQVVALHTLAGQIGWSREQSHSIAGVDSFNDLTREQAAELLDAWAAIAEDQGPGEGEPEHDPAAASSEDLWARAIALYGSRVSVLRAWLEFHPDAGGASAGQVTAGDLAALIRQAEGGATPHDDAEGRDAAEGPDLPTVDRHGTRRST
jgi:hypothetical protein